MKRLEKKFSRKGWDYEVIERIGDVVLLKKRIEGCDRDFHEVCVVQKWKKRVLPGGRVIEAGEGLPSPETWGTSGWSLLTLERAKEKFTEVVAMQGCPQKVMGMG